MDPGILNRNGHSALHKAAIKGHLEFCQWLLTPVSEGGAGLVPSIHMIPDMEGNTPSIFANDNGFNALYLFLQPYQERAQIVPYVDSGGIM